MNKDIIQNKKNVILNAAVKVLTNKGYYSSTMDDIVKESKMSKGAIYHYYSSKKDVYLALIWPSAEKKKEYLSSFKNIIYEKKFRLNYNGAHNFLAQVYKEQKWIGDFSNGYGI